MITLPGITLQKIQILQLCSAALMLKLYHLMTGCFIFSGLQLPPISHSLIFLSVLSSTIYISKMSSAMQPCLPSEFFYNQASPSIVQTIKINSHNLTAYKRVNSCCFPYSTLNTSTGTWNSTRIHAANRKLHAGLFSQSSPSTLSSRPCSFGKFNNNLFNRGRFLKAVTPP